jgi:hypothetical protein
MDRIQGLNGLKLPWERGRVTPAVIRRLGIFKDPIMRLLSRNPFKRPSMSEFCDFCFRLLDGSSSVQQ